MIIEVVLAMAALLLLWSAVSANRRKGMPPGEWGYPVIGHMPSRTVPFDVSIEKLRKKHGNTYTWKIGSRVFVVLNDYKTIKHVFNHPDAQERPDFYSFLVVSESRLGLFNSVGDVWQHTRRFTMRHLRDLGFGKSSLESAIALEAKHLVDEFKKYTGKPCELPMSISIAILNVLWKMVADKRYQLDDPAIQKFEKNVIDIFDESQKAVAIFDIFPFLVKTTPQVLKDYLGIQSYVDKNEKIKNYVYDVVDEHKKTLNPNNPRDFIDEFLIETEKSSNEGNTVFSDENLKISIMDLFTAGGESTTATLKWILIFMAKYPDIQAKVQEEIDSVVPRDRLPGIEDKEQLNYTEAVFNEVQRVVSFGPVGAPHVNSKDMVIDGYTVPKGTILISNTMGCHHDPVYWERPNEFYPEHFLDDKGKVRHRRDGYLPFSVGRRVCPGESLSKLNLYLFATALLQHYTFAAALGEPLSIERDPLQPLVFMPRPCKLKISARL